MKTHRSKPVFIAKPPARVQAMAKKYGILGIKLKAETLGENLLASGYGTFDTHGTESWTVTPNNTITNPSNDLLITYVDAFEGAYVALDSSSGDLASNLADITNYRLTFSAKMTDGFSVTARLDPGAGANIEQAITETEYTEFTLDFEKELGASPVFIFRGFNGTDTISIDWYKVQEIL